jgi:8-oxo-dGTP pyrophosphatase MutT (NUDIX family)
MLRLIPAPLHIVALRVAHGLRKRWWRLAKPTVSGCRVVALDERDRVLLIRHSYGARHWMLPGGGLKRGEDALVAACRELFEETACRIDSAVLISAVTEKLHGTDNDVRVVVGWTTDTPRPDGREIIEAGFFALESLPPNLARFLHDRLPAYLTAAKAARPAR